MMIRTTRKCSAARMMSLLSVNVIKIIIIACALRFNDMVVEADSLSSSNNSKNNNWYDECIVSGFDPNQLACKTCQLVPLSVQTKCLDCCQSYMDTERITKPFQSAVLILLSKSVPSEGELGTFFKDDWDTILETKGTDRIVKILDESAAASRYQKNPFQMMDGGMFSFFQGSHQPTAEIVFLDESLSKLERSRQLSYDKLSKLAKETFSLDGMKREDIKDMIMTLLP